MILVDLFENSHLTETPEFKKWFAGSKIVDANGEPLKLYRGLRGHLNLDQVNFVQPRKGYAMFFSTSPYVAASYANPEEWDASTAGAIYPVYVKATSLGEFPITTRDGRRSFDMFAFDTVASRLGAGQGVVARQIIDIGPRASSKIDPEKHYSRLSDTYSFGPGTEIRSAWDHS